MKIRPGQTIFDVALIVTGDPLKGFEKAVKMGLDPGLGLSGMEIEFSEPPASVILNTYKREGYVPATWTDEEFGIFDETFDETFI